MRKVLLTTFGSYGDLHPFLAMARVLRANGDAVTIATHAEYRDQIERIGVRFIPVKPGFDELGPHEAWSAKANHAFHGIEFILRSLILPYLDDSYRVIKEAAAGHDFLISHALTFATPLVAEQLGIRWISTALQPSPFLSAYDPPALGFMPFLPRLKFLGPVVLRPVLWLLTKPTDRWMTPVTALRARIGLPPSAKNALIDGYSPFGTLALFPAAFAPQQPDWPNGVTQVGFPLFDQETTSEISPALSLFLESGPPPVVFTLGTAIVNTKTHYFEVAYEAIRQLGLRAVFLVGKNPPSIPPAAIVDPNIHISPYEPFSQLFPRAQIIVHQCGIGTTAQALASGRPQILVPFAHDQPDNARRVVELGVGQSIPARRLTVARLCMAIERLTRTDAFAQRAHDLVSRLHVGEFDERLLAAIDQSLSIRN